MLGADEAASANADLAFGVAGDIAWFPGEEGYSVAVAARECTSEAFVGTA